jgi:hypothetical protein
LRTESKHTVLFKNLLEFIKQFLISFFLSIVCPTQEWGVAWDLREMGLAQGKGVRDGQAPQTRREISSHSQRERRQHGAGRRRKDKSGVMKRNQCEQSGHLQKGFLTIIKCL